MNISLESDQNIKFENKHLYIDNIVGLFDMSLPLNQVIQGNCIDVLKTFPENSIDCVVTDPPYGLSFMGKEWDKALPPKQAFVEIKRVLKPGALAFVMSSPRQDLMCRMGILLEDAGFSLSQSFISWVYASGFPKAYDIGKGIDQKLGYERKIIGKNPNARDGGGSIQVIQKSLEKDVLTEPASPEAKMWNGWKSISGLKPALEVIFMVQKPLSEPTIIENVLKWGTGAMNVDACRIPIEKSITYTSTFKRMIDNNINSGYRPETMRGSGGEVEKTVDSRFPANLIVSDDALNDGKTSKSSGGSGIKTTETQIGESGIYGKYSNRLGDGLGGYGDSGSFSRYFDLDAWAKHHGFLNVPKASTSERDVGLENKENKNITPKHTLRANTHPTVKPIKLMAYLIELGCPPKGIVLDPFVGSGTTCIATKQLSRNYIGIELSPEYVEMARKRIDSYSDNIDMIFI